MFALDVLRFVRRFRWCPEAKVIGQQLLGSSMSIGANICEASKARSRAEFCSTLNIALKEGVETRYWLELAVGAELLADTDQARILEELNQICRIISSIILNTKKSAS
jgi:four helix bundle protein